MMRHSLQKFLKLFNCIMYYMRGHVESQRIPQISASENRWFSQKATKVAFYFFARSVKAYEHLLRLISIPG